MLCRSLQACHMRWLVLPMALVESQGFEQLKGLAGAQRKGAFVLPFAPLGAGRGIGSNGATCAELQGVALCDYGANRHIERRAAAWAHHADRAAIHAAFAAL